MSELTESIIVKPEKEGDFEEFEIEAKVITGRLHIKWKDVALDIARGNRKMFDAQAKYCVDRITHWTRSEKFCVDAFWELTPKEIDATIDALTPKDESDEESGN